MTKRVGKRHTAVATLSDYGALRRKAAALSDPDQILAYATEGGWTARIVAIVEEDYITTSGTEILSCENHGTGPDFIPPSEAARPDYSATAINALPGMLLDGTQRLVTDGNVDTGDHEAFALIALFRDTSTALMHVAELGVYTGGDGGMVLATGLTADNIWAQGRRNSNSRVRSPTSYPMTDAGVATATWNPNLTSDETRVRHNGADVVLDWPQNNNNTVRTLVAQPFAWGARNSGVNAVEGAASHIVFLSKPAGPITGAALDAIADIETFLMSLRPAPTLALSGFVNSTNYYSSLADAGAGIGADGGQFVVFRVPAETAAANQVFLTHGTTTAGHLIQQLSDRKRRAYARGTLVGSAYAFDAGDAGNIHSIVMLWSHSSGVLMYYDGCPEAGGGVFTGTSDPAAGAKLWLGVFSNTSLAATSFDILGAGEFAGTPNGETIRDWWASCIAGKSAQAFPGELNGWTAAGQAIGSGTASATLADRTGSADLTITGALDVVDVSVSDWAYLDDGLGSAATAVVGGSGIWTGEPAIMAAGDSITVGVGSSAGRNAWREVFADTLTGASLDFSMVGSEGSAPDNYSAFSGYTIAQMDTLLQSDVVTYSPDVICILIGTNNITAANTRALIASYRAMLVNAFSAGPVGMRVIVGTVPIRTDLWLCERTRYALNDIIRRLVQERVAAGDACHFVETEGAYTAAEIAGDSVHPDDVGHAALAAAFAAGVRTVLHGGAF